MLARGLELDAAAGDRALRAGLLLTRLVLARDAEMAHEQAVRLAGELESFLDELHNEEVDLAGLDAWPRPSSRRALAGDADVPKLVRDGWPGLLEAGAARPDAAPAPAARCAAPRWRGTPRPRGASSPPGSRARMPAVARLLATVARLPRG